MGSRRKNNAQIINLTQLYVQTYKEKRKLANITFPSKLFKESHVLPAFTSILKYMNF